MMGASCLCLLLILVTFNYTFDPYLLHQWDTPAIKRPSSSQPKISPWMKTYAVSKFRPEIVYLGSSRAEIGLPTEVPFFPSKRIFNLALSGASLGDAISMLRHTSFFHQPEMVIWGIDYGWQFREKAGNMDMNSSLIASDSLYPVKRFFLNVKRSLSLTMIGDALSLMHHDPEHQCPSLLAYYGQKPPLCLEQIMRDEGGTPKAFEKITTKGDIQGNPANTDESSRLLESVLDEHCAKGTGFRLFFHPVHALAELSYWGNVPADLEKWKTDLTKMVDRKRQAGCNIRLYDFAGYSPITTEEIPQATGQSTMQYYWEHSHYNSEVGRKMIATMSGQNKAIDQDDDFGMELTPANVLPHLERVRIARQHYCDSHPKETAIMKICRQPSQGVHQKP